MQWQSIVLVDMAMVLVVSIKAMVGLARMLIVSAIAAFVAFVTTISIVTIMAMMIVMIIASIVRLSTILFTTVCLGGTVVWILGT